MKIKIPKIVIGTDLTGMIVAAKENAIFIPVSFCPSFGWEYTNFDVPIIKFIREFLLIKKSFRNVDKHYNKFSISTSNETIFVNCFYWEIERFFEFLFCLNNNMWKNFSYQKCFHNEKCIRFSGSLTDLTVEYDKLIVINPNSSWFSSEILEKTKTEHTELAHIIYYLRLATEEHPDMKGLRFPCDLQTVNNQIFNKVWYNKPFGERNVQASIDVKNKNSPPSTKRLTFITENVPIDQIHDPKFEIGNVRLSILSFLKKYKRIYDHGKSFDKFIKKMIISGEVDYYSNSENENFIYFEDKSEIVCSQNLDSIGWQDSFLRTLFQLMNSTIHLTSINSFPQKILF